MSTGMSTILCTLPNGSLINHFRLTDAAAAQAMSEFRTGFLLARETKMDVMVLALRLYPCAQRSRYRRDLLTKLRGPAFGYRSDIMLAREDLFLGAIVCV